MIYFASEKSTKLSMNFRWSCWHTGYCQNLWFFEFSVFCDDHIVVVCGNFGLNAYAHASSGYSIRYSVIGEQIADEAANVSKFETQHPLLLNNFVGTLVTNCKMYVYNCG